MQPPLPTPFTRRAFLARAAALGSASLLAACAQPTPAAPTAAPAATAPAAPVKPAGTPTATAAQSATGAPAASSAPSGKVTVTLSSDVLTLDPFKDTSPISLNVYKNVFDQLSDIRADGSVGPLLAESWDTKDAVTWDFKLRAGAVFHDGKPVTADDVLWSFNTVMQDAKSPVRSYTAAIDRGEKIDDRTVRFVTKYPYAPFPRQVSLISIVPKDVYQSLGADQFARKPVGSGTYRVVTWAKDDRLDLESFDRYYAGAPRIKTVTFRPVPSESSRVAGLESGDLDIVALLPPPEVPRLRTANGLRVELVESNRNLYLGMNVNNPPFDNLKLRQAVDCAINREQICRDLLGGLGKPVGQPVASKVFGYDSSIAPTAYDPSKGRQLLAESGLGSGISFKLQYPTNNFAFGNEVAQAVAAQLGDIGIRVQLEGMEYAAFFPLWTGKQLQAMHMFGYGPSIMDADLPLGSLYASTGRGYWTSPEIEQLFQKQRGQADPQQRQATISQIWKMSRDFVPYSWLYTEIQAYGIRDRVDWQPRTDERFTMSEAKLKA